MFPFSGGYRCIDGSDKFSQIQDEDGEKKGNVIGTDVLIAKNNGDGPPES